MAFLSLDWYRVFHNIWLTRSFWFWFLTMPPKSRDKAEAKHEPSGGAPDVEQEPNGEGNSRLRTLEPGSRVTGGSMRSMRLQRSRRFQRGGTGYSLKLFLSSDNGFSLHGMG